MVRVVQSPPRAGTAVARKPATDWTSRFPPPRGSPGCDLIPTGSLGTIQRAIGRHQHVFILLIRAILGDPNTRRYEPFRIAHLPARFLDRSADFLGHYARALFAGTDQHDHKLVAAVAPRQIGQPDVGAALPRRFLEHRVAGLVP